MSLYLTSKGQLAHQIFQIADEMLERKMITKRQHTAILRAVIKPPKE